MKVRDYTRAFMAKIKESVIPTTPYEVYSTSETKIGVWTDGKPLYRKAVDIGNFPNANTKTVAHGISNVAIMVTCKVIGKNGNNFSETNYNGATNTGSISFYANTTNVYITTTDNRSAATGYAILEYTKTTDTATSSKVPFQPLVEYSTDEKLVGYWDGEAVYGRMFKGNLPGTSSAVASTTLASGINKIIILKGFVQSSSGTGRVPLPYTVTQTNRCIVYTSNGNLVMANGGDYAGGSYEVYVEYTKA